MESMIIIHRIMSIETIRNYFLLYKIKAVFVCPSNVRIDGTRQCSIIIENNALQFFFVLNLLY